MTQRFNQRFNKKSIMKLIAAFFRLIRWPNLLFIALTQIFFYYFVLHASVINESGENFIKQRSSLFILLVISSVLIAAAGYIINDYFDLKIDAINKPQKIVVDRIVKRRWAIVWHLIFSSIGIIFSFYISYKTKIYSIDIVNFLCVFMLWFYSTTFKRKLLSGNVIISTLTAWVIVSVYLFSGVKVLEYHGWNFSGYVFDARKLFKLTMLYSGFAFVLSLIREVVKDIEDMNGDARYNCRTMPIAWGLPATRVFIGVWMVVLISTIFISIFYAFQSGWKVGSVYSFIFILIPLFYIMIKLLKAESVKDYRKLSLAIKFTMFAGIISMIFFFPKFLFV